MLESGVSRENGVVRLNNGVGHGRRGVDGKLELGLLAVVGGKTLQDESTETGTSSTTERVEDEEALKTIAVIREAADFVHHGVDHLLAHSVVSTGVCSDNQLV